MSNFDSWDRNSSSRDERRNSFSDERFFLSPLFFFFNRNFWYFTPLIDKVNFFFRENYQDREVNSFQFPDEGIRNARESPELGIREVSVWFETYTFCFKSSFFQHVFLTVEVPLLAVFI